MTFWIDSVAREAMLFAAVGLLIGGVDDLAVDLVYWVRRAWKRGDPRATLAQLGAPVRPGRMIVFVPAWDEAAVIGAMLRATLTRFGAGDYRILVGAYPNDPATIAAVAEVAAEDERVRLVVGERDGPTTKADCLNTLWRALGSQGEVKAVVLHDAEDVVHPLELAVFDRLIEDHGVVQLPVLPLIAKGSIVSALYADEFAESHGRQMVARVALGAAMPLAGVGCAIRTDILARLADTRGGDPFDADSLTEDYELGIRIAEMGERAIFARVADQAGNPVAVRAYFPADIGSAVRQKARWMIGIALAGWDRVGWGRGWAIGDHWMRARDRRAPLAMVVLGAAYLGLVAWVAGIVAHTIDKTPSLAIPGTLTELIAVNALLLGWRMTSRCAFTTRAYGWRQGVLAVPRLVVGNIVALMAARRALVRYAAMLGGRRAVWDKTRHVFPDLATLEPQ